MALRLRRAIRNRIPKGPAGDAIRERFGDDSACTRCDKCCHQGFIIKGQFIFIPELPCRYLDRMDDGRYRCTVFATRHHVPWCHAVTEETVGDSARGINPSILPYLPNLPLGARERGAGQWLPLVRPGMPRPQPSISHPCI